MSMEKYGTDFSNLPVTDDQLRTINGLSKIAGTVYEMPKNREQAEDLIEKLTKET